MVTVHSNTLRAAILGFSVNFVRKKNTLRNVTVNNNFSC
nr:MAG TPA: hypothetical protein [Caudoviricetes sp.]